MDSPRPEEARLRELKLLVDHRDDLVDERRRAQQRLRWHLHELDPTLRVPLGALDRAVWLERLSRQLARRTIYILAQARAYAPDRSGSVQSVPRELVWRAVAAVIFAAVFGWSIASGRWVVAGLSGVFGLATLASLALGFFAWRQGVVRGHS